MAPPPGRHAAGQDPGPNTAPNTAPNAGPNTGANPAQPAGQRPERDGRSRHEQLRPEQHWSEAGVWPERVRGEAPVEVWTEHAWVDRDAGPVVRPYAMTGGRVRPASGGFDVVAMVVAIRSVPPDAGYGLQPEHRAILAFAREPLAVAELASHLDLALGVVRVLLGDLLGQGLIEMYEPPAAGGLPSESILKAVINGLRAL